MAKKQPTKKTAPQPAPKPAQLDDETRRRIAAHEAAIKKLRGDKLTLRNQQDIAWLEKTDRRKYVDQWIEAVPKGDYCTLASRQHKLIDDAAENYDLPIGGSTINLKAAITRLHDFIAANAHRLRAEIDGDMSELKEEKLRQEIMMLEKQNERAAIELQYTRGDAIPRAQLRESLVILSAQLRTLGQTLARIDPEARDALNQFLESLSTEIESGALAF